MHKESTGVKQLFQKNGMVAITSFNPITKENYLAVFNLSDEKEPKEISVALSDLGISKSAKLTDMWTGQSLKKVRTNISTTLAAHSCRLYSIK